MYRGTGKGVIYMVRFRTYRIVEIQCIYYSSHLVTRVTAQPSGENMEKGNATHRAGAGRPVVGERVGPACWRWVRFYVMNGKGCQNGCVAVSGPCEVTCGLESGS